MEQIRQTFNYIDDAVNGTVLAMEKGGNGEIYHIGTQESTIKELIQYTGELMGFNGKYIDAPTYPGSVADVVLILVRLKRPQL